MNSQTGEGSAWASGEFLFPSQNFQNSFTKSSTGRHTRALQKRSPVYCFHRGPQGQGGKKLKRDSICFDSTQKTQPPQGQGGKKLTRDSIFLIPLRNHSPHSVAGKSLQEMQPFQRICCFYALQCLRKVRGSRILYIIRS